MSNLVDYAKNELKRNCQSCKYYKDGYCENLELEPNYPNVGCDDFQITPKSKIGRWVKHDTGHSIYYDCSLCSCVAPYTETADKWLWKLSNFCPDCGAKMESEDKNGNTTDDLTEKNCKTCGQKCAIKYYGCSNWIPNHSQGGENEDE